MLYLNMQMNQIEILGSIETNRQTWNEEYIYDKLYKYSEKYNYAIFIKRLTVNLVTNGYFDQHVNNVDTGNLSNRISLFRKTFFNFYGF